MLASLSQQSFRVDVSSSSSRRDIGCDANIGALTLTENTEGRREQLLSRTLPTMNEHFGDHTHGIIGLHPERPLPS